MNSRSIHPENWSRYLACVIIALAGIILSPTARAVTPAPDGGYPNRNTAEGTDALFSWPTTTSDGENTAIGFDALHQDNNGTNNTATGSFALFNNTSGSFNTAIGFEALQSNTTPYNNTAIVLQRSAPIPPAAKTPLAVPLRFLLTQPATTTPPPVSLLSKTVRRITTPLRDSRHSLPTPAAAKIPPWVLRLF